MGLGNNSLRQFLVGLILVLPAACVETRYYQAPKQSAIEPFRSVKPNIEPSTITVEGPDADIRLIDGALTISEEREDKYYKDNEVGPVVEPIQWPRSIRIAPGFHVLLIGSAYSSVVIALNVEAGHDYEIVSPVERERGWLARTFSFEPESLKVWVVDKTSGKTVLGWRAVRKEQK